MDRDRLVALQSKRDPRGSLFEHAGQYAHADEIGAMDALEALRDHRAHAEQLRALGRPVARGARAVFAAREHDERNFLALISHRGVVDPHPLPGWIMEGVAAFD